MRPCRAKGPEARHTLVVARNTPCVRARSGRAAGPEAAAAAIEQALAPKSRRCKPHVVVAREIVVARDTPSLQETHSRRQGTRSSLQETHMCLASTVPPCPVTTHTCRCKRHTVRPGEVGPSRGPRGRGGSGRVLLRFAQLLLARFLVALGDAVQAERQAFPAARGSYTSDGVCIGDGGCIGVALSYPFGAIYIVEGTL